MSASFQVWAGDLKIASSSTSLLPIGLHTPVSSFKNSRGNSTWLCGMPFLTAKAVSSFLPGKRSVGLK
jgi:hypothetical protein